MLAKMECLKKVLFQLKYCTEGLIKKGEEGEERAGGKNLFKVGNDQK
jgi:hypothetical protein